MNRQHGTRRMILGALVVMVAATTALGAGRDAGAVHIDKLPDYGNTDLMAWECSLMEGEFSQSGSSTSCTLSHGAHECDQNGKDCWYVPIERQQTSEEPVVAPGGAGAAGSGNAGQSVSAPDDDQDTNKAKGKKSKKGKKDGKGRKK